MSKLGVWLPYKYSKCFNCNNLWEIRLIEIDNDIKEELKGFIRSSKVDEQTKTHILIHTCLNCNYSFSQNYQITTEEEFIKRLTENEKQIDLDSLTANSEIINETISGNEITDEKLYEIIKQMENKL